MQHKLLLSTLATWIQSSSKSNSKTDSHHSTSLAELQQELNVVLERIRNIEITYFNEKNFSIVLAIEHLSPISQRLHELFASSQIICEKIYQKVTALVGKKNRLSKPSGLIIKIADRIENLCHRIKNTAADKKLTLEEYNKLVDDIGRVKLWCGNLNESIQYLINRELKDELKNIVVLFPSMQKSVLMMLIKDLESNGEKDELIALLKRYILSHEVVKINLDGIIQPSDFVSSLNEKEKKFAYDYYVYYAILEEEQRSAAYRVLSSGAKLATLHNLKQIGSLSQDVWVDEILPKLNREGRSRLARSCSFFPPLVSAVNSRVKKRYTQRDYAATPICQSLEYSRDYLVSLDQQNIATYELVVIPGTHVEPMQSQLETKELVILEKEEDKKILMGSIMCKISDHLLLRNHKDDPIFYIWDWKTGELVQKFHYPNADNNIQDVARMGDCVLFASRYDNDLSIYRFRFNGEKIINDIGYFETNLVASIKGAYVTDTQVENGHFTKLLTNKAGVICALTIVYATNIFSKSDSFSKIIVCNEKKKPVFLLNSDLDNDIQVNDICLLGDNHLIGFCIDRIMMWELEDFKLIKTIQLSGAYSEGRVLALQDGKVVVAGTASHRRFLEGGIMKPRTYMVQIYDIQTETFLNTTYQNGPIKALALVENGNVAVLSSEHLSFLRFPEINPALALHEEEKFDAEIETMAPRFNHA